MKRDKKKLVTDPVQEKIAGNIVRRWIRFQEGWATLMQRMFERFSVAGKKLVLVCMCILFGGYSLYMIAQNIIHPGKTFSIVTPIKGPQHVLKSGEPKRSFDAKAEYEKIEGLKHYRDSLNKIYKTK